MQSVGSAWWELALVRAGVPAMLDDMTTRTVVLSRVWRWVLIVSESLVVTYLVAVELAERDARHPTAAFLVGSILASVAWAFLFFGSPFLASSQRWLAI